MLRLQYKLFFRSRIRNLMFVIMFLGCIAYHVYLLLVRYGIDYLHDYGAIDVLRSQMAGFVYFFIIVLFVAYDYFGEMADANLLEIARTTSNYLKNDMVQFWVMLNIVIAYGLLNMSFSVMFFHFSDTLTCPVFLYLCKLFGLYIILNGIIAVLLSWLLSRTVNKILGYVCIILFACFVSPLMTKELEILSMVYRNIHSWMRIFILMPEGFDFTYNPYTLYPVNLSLTARSFFWIFLFGACLLFCYRIKKRKLWLIVNIAITIFMFVYTNLPTSFFCANNAYDETDSLSYNQAVYMLDEEKQLNEAPGFLVETYEMQLELERQMKAEVTIYLDTGALSEYAFTLYHLYHVDSVVDGKGNALGFDQQGDYLTVYNPQQNVDTLCIRYRGGCANYYSNATEIYLPGWFAYYPIPGYKEIYKDYNYINNTLENKAMFDIEIHADTEIYADIKRIGENHFQGNSTGVSLIGGFVKQVELADGITCIYPYLDKWYDPYSQINEEDYAICLKKIQSDLEENNSEHMTIFFTPHLAGEDIHHYNDETMVGFIVWKNWAYNYREYGSFERPEEENELSEEQLIEIFVDQYWSMKESGDVLTYSFVRDIFDGTLESFGAKEYTKEEFEIFIATYLGEEELLYLKENDEN